MKGFGVIRNPLTIVGVFATLAEIAGTAVLPSISVDLQRIFVWYVMLMPAVLVILFFATWNFNAKVLYTPSDFSNEENYMKLALKDKMNMEKKLDDAIKSVNHSITMVKEIAEKVSTGNASTVELITALDESQSRISDDILKAKKSTGDILAYTIIDLLTHTNAMTFNGIWAHCNGANYYDLKNTLANMVHNGVLVAGKCIEDGKMMNTYKLPLDRDFAEEHLNEDQ